MIRAYWESLPAERFPNTRALLDDLLTGGPDERFEWGLDVIVRGLAATAIESETGNPPPSRRGGWRGRLRLAVKERAWRWGGCGANFVAPTTPQVVAATKLRALVLQREMKSERLVEVDQERRRHDTYAATKTLDSYGSNLFGLSLGVAVETGSGGLEKDLERIEALDVRRHRHHAYDTAAQPRSGRIRSIVAHDDARTALGSFRPAHGIKINDPDFATAHQS